MNEIKVYTAKEAAVILKEKTFIITSLCHWLGVKKIAAEYRLLQKDIDYIKNIQYQLKK